jgi:hypothetical protein
VNAQLVVGVSGLLMVIAVPLAVTLPFVLRRAPLPGRVASQAAGRVFLARMRPHYWLGYLVAALTVTHALVALTGGVARDANALGLFLAWTALFVVFWQVTLGGQLRRPAQPERPALRRLHLWSMIVLVALGVGHILLNSPTLARLAR